MGAFKAVLARGAVCGALFRVSQFKNVNPEVTDHGPHARVAIIEDCLNHGQSPSRLNNHQTRALVLDGCQTDWLNGGNAASP